ncbi:hypothetical protein BDR07DRAFT_1395986 [Suillus spraguei]|nr:hypothetical protein BDR07DRAFT_1395986 [Suillus spraguei]
MPKSGTKTPICCMVKTQQGKVHKACAELWEDLVIHQTSGEQWLTIVFFMAVSLVDENAALRPAESLPELSVPRSIVDSMTCSIQRAHPHPLLPILSFMCTSFFTLVTLLSL